MKVKSYGSYYRFLVSSCWNELIPWTKDNGTPIKYIGKTTFTKTFCLYTFGPFAIMKIKLNPEI